MFNKWRNKIKIKQTHSLEGWNGSSSLLIVCTERQESIEREKYFWMYKKKQKWVQTSQTCFQRGLLKEIFFKFYKVQPLIMLSHNQSLQSITVSSFQVIATIWYDYGVLGFWSLQYGSCHWVFFLFSKRLWELPWDTAQLFFLSSCVSDMLLLTDFHTFMQ